MAPNRTSDSTTSSLLERLRSGDPQAWQRLSDLYATLVYRWARMNKLQAGDAADVTQEVFQSVASNIERFRRDRAGDSFRGWLWAITRNKIHDHFRRQADEPRAAGGTAAHERIHAISQELPDAPNTTVSGFDADAALVRRALRVVEAEFEPKTFRAFWRTAIDGQRAADVAEELGMSTAAVYMAKSRVFRRLRMEMEGLFD